MGGKALPVINFSPFRKYPSKRALQEYADEKQVCGDCLSGACCTTEDPIYLTSFDVFRLAAFFDLPPADFLSKFTQDGFEGEDSELMRRSWIDDPESSKVTYLRRRAGTPRSPCIFLKYVNEPDGTPRRICSVHDARPLSCREFYFHHCKNRVTGEIASLLAEGFEMVRDRLITDEMVDERLAGFRGHDFSTATQSESLEYTFWVEMKRVLNMEQANVEGSRSYRAADYQDPIDEKLNRVLSAKYLRFEESYGPEPNSEQLMPYTTGLGFVASPERKRIMRLLRDRPSSGLFQLGDYPFRAGLRTMVTGVRHAELFDTIPEHEVDTTPGGAAAPVQLFPDHPLQEARAITRRDLSESSVRGLNHLIRFSSYVATMGSLIEGEPPGLLEMSLLKTIAGLEPVLDRHEAYAAHFQPVKQHMAGAAIGLLEDSLASARKPADNFEIYRQLYEIRPALPSLSAELRARFELVTAAALERLEKDRVEQYVRTDNPIAARLVQGKRLNAAGAWAAWERQTTDTRYAAAAGFERVNTVAFYRRAIDDLEKIPFRRSYAVELYRVMLGLARGMSGVNQAPGRQEIERLAAYGMRLFEWMDGAWGYEGLEIEMLAGFSVTIREGKADGDRRDRISGLITHTLLNSQLPDGSWGTDALPEDVEDWQEDYLHKMFRITGACLDAMPETQGERLNAKTVTPGLK